MAVGCRGWPPSLPVRARWLSRRPRRGRGGAGGRRELWRDITTAVRCSFARDKTLDPQSVPRSFALSGDCRPSGSVPSSGVFRGRCGSRPRVTGLAYPRVISVRAALWKKPCSLFGCLRLLRRSGQDVQTLPASNCSGLLIPGVIKNSAASLSGSDLLVVSSCRSSSALASVLPLALALLALAGGPWTVSTGTFRLQHQLHRLRQSFVCLSSGWAARVAGRAAVCGTRLAMLCRRRAPSECRQYLRHSEEKPRRCPHRPRRELGRMDQLLDAAGRLTQVTRFPVHCRS